jgi:hypothetical protein
MPCALPGEFLLEEVLCLDCDEATLLGEDERGGDKRLWLALERSGKEAG